MSGFVSTVNHRARVRKWGKQKERQIQAVYDFLIRYPDSQQKVISDELGLIPEYVKRALDALLASKRIVSDGKYRAKFRCTQ